MVPASSTQKIRQSYQIRIAACRHQFFTRPGTPAGDGALKPCLQPEQDSPAIERECERRKAESLPQLVVSERIVGEQLPVQTYQHTDQESHQRQQQ